MVSEKSFHSNHSFWVVKRRLTQPFYYNAESGGFEHYVQDSTKFFSKDVAEKVAELMNCDVIGFYMEFHKCE